MFLQNLASGCGADGAEDNGSGSSPQVSGGATLLRWPVFSLSEQPLGKDAPAA